MSNWVTVKLRLWRRQISFSVACKYQRITCTSSRSWLASSAHHSHHLLWLFSGPITCSSHALTHPHPAKPKFLTNASFNIFYYALSLMEDKNRTATKGWHPNAFFSGPVQCIRRMNDILIPSLPLLIVRLIIIVFGITITIPNILAVILTLNISFGLTLLLAFMHVHVHGNPPVPVPHCLPSCLLRSLVSPHIVNLFAS